MCCRKCHGCLTWEHKTVEWLGGWRCINCGDLFDEVVFINRIVSRVKAHEEVYADSFA